MSLFYQVIHTAAELKTIPGSPDLPRLDPGQFEREAADAHVLVSEDGGPPLARCSLWWRNTPVLNGRAVGAIGHYASSSDHAAAILLDKACEELARAGASFAVGPLDGNTWRKHRFVVERGTEPAFFFEPEHPQAWPQQFLVNGFDVLANYYSALHERLTAEDPRIERAAQRFREAGGTIRVLRMDDFEAELRRIYTLSIASFHDNFLYSPIPQQDFLAQYQAIQPHVRPELVLIAEQDKGAVGFIFAMPDLAQARGGHPINTVILKTVAILPERRYAGLGGYLVGHLQTLAWHLGYQRVIHAFMHEKNPSLNLSRHYARVIRRYALFVKDFWQ